MQDSGRRTIVTEWWVDKQSQVPKNSQEAWLLLGPRYRPGLSFGRSTGQIQDGTAQPRSLKNSLPLGQVAGGTGGGTVVALYRPGLLTLSAPMLADLLELHDRMLPAHRFGAMLR